MSVGLLIGFLLHIIVCGWMLRFCGRFVFCESDKGIFVLLGVILLGFWYVFLFSRGMVGCGMEIRSCVFEIIQLWRGVYGVGVFGSGIYCFCFNFLQFQFGFYEEVWGELVWLYLCSQKGVGFVYNWELMGWIELLYQPRYSDFIEYGFTIKGIDWCCVWDDLFINIYDLGYLLVGGGFSRSLDSLYLVAICRVLEGQLGDPIGLYREGLDLGVYEAEVWVVDAMADFILGGFWSFYFYLLVAIVTAVFLYAYIQIVIFAFCFYLEIKIGVLDIFVW